LAIRVEADPIKSPGQFEFTKANRRPAQRVA
jgi:hypothetical protein